MQNQYEDDFLCVTALTKRFLGGNGICDVSLSIPQGSITGFIGVNGAGKSTTLRCVLGLIRPDAGQIRLFGAPACVTSRTQIGFLPEDRGLFPHERAREAIAFHGQLKGMGRRQALFAADKLLERIGLGGHQSARIESLSKGNAQRVQVICAMVHRPRLLILDEPLSGLDPIAQAEMLSLFAEFRGAGGAILFSTHSMASVENFCDRVVMLAAGRTVFEGNLGEACERAPHGAMVVTNDEAGLVAAAEAVGGRAQPVASAIGEARSWRVVLPRNVTHPALIRALVERAVTILAFQPIKANLEGAFWDMAAEAVPNPAARSRAA
ncbi:MAG: ATP-binding cassette domain-containing protein [Anaerolineales bacterium]